MHPKFPEFKRLSASDIGLINEYTSGLSGDICEFSVGNLLAWEDFDRPSFTFIDESLCIRIDPVDEPPFFLEPIGGADRHGAIMMCLEHAGKLSRVSLETALNLRDLPLKIYEVPDHFDYVYSTKDLAELRGRKYDGKRNHIKRMTRHLGEYEYFPLSKKDAPEILGFMEVWLDIKRREDAQSQPCFAFSCQYDAIKKVFDYYDNLGLLGGKVVSRGRIVGFSVGSHFNDRAACMHYCYGDPNVPGSFQGTLREACGKTFAKYEYVNLEQDLGLPGLRKLKNSYHPLRVVKKFEILKK